MRQEHNVSGYVRPYIPITAKKKQDDPYPPGWEKRVARRAFWIAVAISAFVVWFFIW